MPSTQANNGSIPACAGEPLSVHCWSWPIRVYPRVCGGTSTYTLAVTTENGLSPRVRGNLQDLVSALGCGRSIPACAGEPIYLLLCHTAPPVYPRVCGGTCCVRWVTPPNIGLSPRVRGNQGDHSRSAAACGSIPACAGEPRRNAIWLNQVKVYPRVCGGTPKITAAPKR